MAAIHQMSSLYKVYNWFITIISNKYCDYKFFYLYIGNCTPIGCYRKRIYYRFKGYLDLHSNSKILDLVIL